MVSFAVQKILRGIRSPQLALELISWALSPLQKLLACAYILTHFSLMASELQVLSEVIRGPLSCCPLFHIFGMFWLFQGSQPNPLHYSMLPRSRSLNAFNPGVQGMLQVGHPQPLYEAWAD